MVRGNLKLLILRAIEQKGETYGYEIQKDILEMSGGELDITYGSLYPALHKLKADGLIRTREDASGSRKRVFYSLTDEGRRTLVSWKEDWVDFFRFMSRVLDIKPGLST